MRQRQQVDASLGGAFQKGSAMQQETTVIWNGMTSMILKKMGPITLTESSAPSAHKRNNCVQLIYHLASSLKNYSTRALKSQYGISTIRTEFSHLISQPCWVLYT